MHDLDDHLPDVPSRNCGSVLQIQLAQRLMSFNACIAPRNDIPVVNHLTLTHAFTVCLPLFPVRAFAEAVFSIPLSNELYGPCNGPSIPLFYLLGVLTFSLQQQSILTVA
ncbi:hypothetical protein CC2G_006090 [Coprinopsis cinerea AmutBmut pab1-1]|nr:hypothetical protein CC2G_006090 [Coprinopsis cinerea AmutBmut pab1-1]